jgi:preprotein translocase subunit YajC
MVFIALIPTLIGVVILAIGVAMAVREQRQKDRKMAELEAELAEAREKLTAKQ